MKIQDRILVALSARPQCMYELARSVFPIDQYPKAYNQPRHGGPPGCYLPLGKALNNMRGEVQEYWHNDRTYWKLRKNKAITPPQKTELANRRRLDGGPK